eukprot:119709-Chlamydomonas_euryale.AAC.3
MRGYMRGYRLLLLTPHTLSARHNSVWGVDTDKHTSHTRRVHSSDLEGRPSTTHPLLRSPPPCPCILSGTQARKPQPLH